jgi:hypothetical protein
MATFDPATWREAARQLREEADNVWNEDNTMHLALHLLARRFDNEAKAAEEAKDKS